MRTREDIMEDWRTENADEWYLLLETMIDIRDLLEVIAKKNL